MSSDGRLTGSLAALSLPGLVQLLAAEGRTGRIDVRSAARAGSLFLDGGLLAHAACGEGEAAVTGEAALEVLLGVSEGTFEFTPAVVAPERTLHGPTEQLLMEAAVRRDHARRGDAGSLPAHAVPSFAPVPKGGSTPRFTTLQWRVLASIDGRKDVATLAAEVQLPVTVLGTLLAELEAAGVIQVT